MITVDPGVDYFAWARWYDRTLTACGVWRAGAAWPVNVDGRVIVEVPDRRWRGTERDVMDLAAAAGFYAGRLSTGGAGHTFVTPQAWKGQVPKTIHHTRIRAALGDAEVAHLPRAKGELVHVLDAVGIGLWALGRAA